MSCRVYRILQITEFDACPRRPCNNGYYPIHEAAKNASSKTMEVFFQASTHHARLTDTAPPLSHSLQLSLSPSCLLPLILKCCAIKVPE